MRGLPATARFAWIMVFALLSVVVALVTYMLKRSTGAGRADAVLVAGPAFAGALVLCLGVLTAVAGL